MTPFENKLSDLMAVNVRRAEEANATMRADFEAGVRDCAAGIYDKWYRYHREGIAERAYDLGWEHQNLETQNKNPRYIEVNNLF